MGSDVFVVVLAFCIGVLVSWRKELLQRSGGEVGGGRLLGDFRVMGVVGVG